MKVLVIGGTRFVGKHFVREALDRGHEVTLFNRGNQPPPDGVAALIRGDRNSQPELLRDGSWDAVVDTCGYFPRQVREAAAALAGRAGHYTFISSISVYADQATPGQDESAPVIELADPETEEVTGETYGGLKVLCERALAENFGGGRLVVRPGLIVGPDDPTDRFTYWPARVARGGEVLAPVEPGFPVQWIDVTNLAAWLVDSLERGLTGTYNAVSRAGQFTMGELLDAAARLSGADARFTWVDERFLVEHGVGPFMELPLWLPAGSLGFTSIDGSRAHAQGLRIDPVADTVERTLDWYATRGELPWRAGLSAERERDLLRAWHERRTAATG